MSLNFLYHFGRYILMMKTAIAKPEKFSMYWKETMRQMNDIGVGSLIIVILIAFFIRLNEFLKLKEVKENT